ncbi:hypothetical protein XENOCAPTIV_027278 [Xenoophorus captivus]|uniref:Peptidase S1 domain-containing protein n=1 Tax=Xenoophorus captivus TaxID=1517983 RepID=A0ABV0RCX7_9TELE
MCLGKHNLTTTKLSKHCINISGIYCHEGFQYPTVPTVEFDVVLVRLFEDATPTDEISFACLPSEEEILPEGKKCYANGWGDETGANSFSCSTSDLTSGPLVCQDTPGGPWEVHAITSFGPIGCIMNKKPSVFTRSSAYLPWISDVIRRDIYNEHNCGGPMDLPGEDGTISSLDYPSMYSINARCQWNIEVPARKLVNLHFSGFSLEESQLCMNDKVSFTGGVGSLGM